MVWDYTLSVIILFSPLGTPSEEDYICIIRYAGNKKRLKIKNHSLMSSILLLNGRLINEGIDQKNDIYIENDLIVKIDKDLSAMKADRVIDLEGQVVMPGVIDDQVHFREPGLTGKATIYSESRAAVAGGVTSFMEMPNTVPNATTLKLLEDKYRLASASSLANYSFFLGATNDNIEEILSADPRNICGIKIFMGSSTGNMLVNNAEALELLFEKSPMLIATHCEDESTIKENVEKYKERYGDDVPWSAHAEIRSREACYKSSSYAVELAKKHGSRLHVLHISTEDEIALFDNKIPLRDKKITAEVCVHHLWFEKIDYETKGSLIKWNPSVKEKHDKEALFEAMLHGYLDVIATDHAPHTMEEKNGGYWSAPSGGPLVQHSLVAMLEFYHQGKISLGKIVEKMAHNPAICFQMEKRGFLREGYKADIVVVDLDNSWKVNKDNILYQCQWSPFEGERFKSKVTRTIVSGHLAYENGQFDETKKGERLIFSR